MVEELLQRLRDEEDSFTERKPESAGKGDWKRTLVAFANTVPEGRTAVLFIGVADNGEPLGVQNSDSLQKKIRRICKHECYPPVVFETKVLRVEGKVVVAITIPESFSRPHFAGHAYVRQGSESVIASDELFEDLVSSRVEPAREIIKHKDDIITVMAHRKLLGSTKSLGDNRYMARHECRVESCNPHFVNLYDFSTKQLVTEPLKNVTVSFDHKFSRFQLDIEPK